MEELINLLHTGGYSCVIANEGKIRTFTQRGVADLYDLLTREPEFLKGALIADKVVGKGACRPHDFRWYKRVIYRCCQFKRYGLVSDIRCKSRLCTGSALYMESRPYRLVSRRNYVQ